jgi:hypothetical protein
VYLLGLKAKIAALLDRGKLEIGKPFDEMSFESLEHAEDLLCKIFDPMVPSDDRWRAVVERVSRFVGRLMALYLDQNLADPEAYEPLSSFNIGKIEKRSAAAMGDLHWLFLALSCILQGERRGYWTVEAPVDRSASEGQILLRAGAGRFPYFSSIGPCTGRALSGRF